MVKYTWMGVQTYFIKIKVVIKSTEDTLGCLFFSNTIFTINIVITILIEYW